MESIQSVSFKVGPSRDGAGFPLPGGSVVPKMRGRRRLNVLAGVPCSFWACKGPGYPRNMVICSKCSAMRDIAAVRMTLIRSMESLGK